MLIALNEYNFSKANILLSKKGASNMVAMNFEVHDFRSGILEKKARENTRNWAQP